MQTPRAMRLSMERISTRSLRRKPPQLCVALFCDENRLRKSCPCCLACGIRCEHAAPVFNRRSSFFVVSLFRLFVNIQYGLSRALFFAFCFHPSVFYSSTTTYSSNISQKSSFSLAMPANEWVVGGWMGERIRVWPQNWFVGSRQYSLIGVYYYVRQKKKVRTQ